MKKISLCLLLACAAHAGMVYNVSLDTTPLLSHPAAPFSLSFQLADGSGTGDGNNAAVLSGFTFGGGTPVGSPILIGSAFGDLTSAIVLTDSGGLGYFAQTFTPGTILGFQLELTTDVDSGGIPDAFFFSILDSSLTALPTSAGSPFDYLAEIDLDSDNPTVFTYAGDVGRSPTAGGGAIGVAAPTVASDVPEPGCLLLAAIGLAFIASSRTISGWRSPTLCRRRRASCRR
jgi:hypothetical protein